MQRSFSEEVAEQWLLQLQDSSIHEKVPNEEQLKFLKACIARCNAEQADYIHMRDKKTVQNQ